MIRFFDSVVRFDYGVGRTSFLTDRKLVVDAKVDDTCVVCEVDFLVSIRNGKVSDVFDKSALYFIFMNRIIGRLSWTLMSSLSVSELFKDC